MMRYFVKMGFPSSSVGNESAYNVGDPDWIPGSGRSAGEGLGYPFQYSWAFLVVQHGKESACKKGNPGLITGCKRRPWRRQWLPNPEFLPGEFQGQSSLVGYRLKSMGLQRVGHDWVTKTFCKNVIKNFITKARKKITAICVSVFIWERSFRVIAKNQRIHIHKLQYL